MSSPFWKNLAKPIIGLSPMDGITDSAFRQMVLLHGRAIDIDSGTPQGTNDPDSSSAGLAHRFPSVVFTEFTTVEGLSHGATKPLFPFIYNQNEHPIIAQIFGIDPTGFYQACFIIAELGFDGIDINMGCPSKSVATHGAGAGLIRTPKLAQEIVRACRRASLDYTSGRTLAEAGVHADIISEISKIKKQRPQGETPLPPLLPHVQPLDSSRQALTSIPASRNPLPISVKTRIGYEKPVTEEWLKYLLEVEPDNISLHGRTLTQMYSGTASWEEIGKAADLVRNERPTTTFLGNGDIIDLPDAFQKTAQYRLDGVLVGRATFGNPWFFKLTSSSTDAPSPSSPTPPSPPSATPSATPGPQISPYLPSPVERLAAALEHAELYESIYGQNPKAFAPMKKHLGWYCKNFPGAKELRLTLMSANSASDVARIIEDFQIIK